MHERVGAGQQERRRRAAREQARGARRGQLAAQAACERRAINWLPLVVIVWANLHGGFVFAFFILGLTLAASPAGTKATLVVE